MPFQNDLNSIDKMWLFVNTLHLHLTLINEECEHLHFAFTFNSITFSCPPEGILLKGIDISLKKKLDDKFGPTPYSIHKSASERAQVEPGCQVL